MLPLCQTLLSIYEQYTSLVPCNIKLTGTESQTSITHPSIPPIQTYLSVHSFFHASIKYYIFLFYFLLTHFLDCTHQKIDFEKMKKNCPNNFLDFFHVYQALHNTTQHNMIFTRLPPKVFSY